jgi:ribulose-phosphate 3-epimerase|tara:strand:- start:1831 stop:2589 length:759 start_codon:yes stop_codon:yes gene_type:complete
MKIFKYLVNIRFILPNEKDNTLTPFIAPSILSADFARLGEEVNAVLDAGADIIHFDVMDNRFVPNLTIGPLVCQSLRDFGVKAPIDVHLMAEPVDNLILDFSKAGASYISFHPEASRHVHRSLNLIREKGCKAGLVFSPATPLTWLEHLIDDLDLILIMSVNPGFGGQSFIESSLDKINEVRKIIDSSGNNIRLEVDGGVKVQNIKEIAAAGADTFVAGSAIFNSNNYSETISAMKAEIQLAGPLILKDTDN